MNTLRNVVLYNLMRFKYSALVVTLVLLGLSLITKFLSLTVSDGDVIFNGHDLVLAVFIFVYFIANNKEDFNHLSISGVTRKSFFVGKLIFIPIASFILVIVTWLSTGFANLLNIDSTATAPLFYPNSSFLSITVWIFCLFILLSLIGLLCGILYYKFGKIAVFAIIFLPQILMALFTYIVNELNVYDEVSTAVQYYFGVLNGPNPLLASLNFIITCTVLTIINWSFIRKISIKV